MRLLLCVLAVASVGLVGCQLLPKSPELRQPLPSAAQTLPLTGTRWNVQHIDRQNILATKAERGLYLTFDAAEQRVSGFSGCNRVFGPYIQQEQRLSVQLASTRMACLDDKGQETRFMQALSMVRRFEIQGQQLNLMDEQGHIRLRLLAQP